MNYAVLKSRAMEPIRTGLRHIMSDFLKTQPQEEAALLAWPLVCGSEIASRTKALKFSEGRLTVEVPDATWQGHLGVFTPRYLAGFEELMGPVVKEVKFEAQK